MAKFTQRIWAEPPAYRGLGERPPDVAGPRIFCLGDDIRIALDLDGAGHLLLLDKGPEGTIYCLCPSWFAPVTCIRPGRAYLPQANASWGAFRLTGKPGREYLLAITTEDALGLDWLPPDGKPPARVLAPTDLDLLLSRLRSVEQDRRSILYTYFDVVE